MMHQSRHVPVLLAIVASLVSGLPLGCSSLTSVAPKLSSFLEPTSSNDKIALARLKEKRGDHEGAEAAYREVLQESPKDLEAMRRLAVCLTKRKNFEEADLLFQQALESNPQSAPLLNDYGYRFFLEENATRAEAYFRKALAIDSDFTPAITNLALALGELGRFEEAQGTLQRSTRNPVEVHCVMGFIYSRKSLLDRALQEFNQALEIEPSNEVALEGLMQVSSRIPGREPRTIVKTTAHALGSPPLEESDEMASLELSTIARSLPPVAPPVSNLAPSPAQN